MNVEVTREYAVGKVLDKQVQQNHQRTGLLSIVQEQMRELNRSTLKATLKHATDGLQSPMLELYDVSVIYLDGNIIRLRGIEQYKEAFYAQLWKIKVLNVKG